MPVENGRIATADSLAFLTILSASLYGLAWIFYNAVLAQVNIEPEEAGFGSEFLAVRAFVVLGVVLGLCLVSVLLFGARLISSSGTETASPRFVVFELIVSAICMVVFLAACGVAFVLLSYEAGVQKVPAIAISVVGSAAFSFFVGLLLRAGFSTRLGGAHLGTGEPSRRYLYAVFLAGMMFAALLVHSAGVLVGESVKDGSAVRSYAISIRGVYLERATRSHDLVIANEDRPSIDASDKRCLLLLGARNETFVVYDSDSETTLFIPSGDYIVVNAEGDC